MMKKLLILFFVLSLNQPAFSQIQLGQDINGGNSGEQCGFSLDMSNDGQRIIVGSPNANSTGFPMDAKGEARVFELINGSWVQVGNDIIGTSGENFGFSVCMSGEGTSFAVGGPKDLNLLYSLDDFQKSIKSLKIHKLEEIIVELNEGNGHIGEASVIRLIAQKV